ncbi:MAG: CBS domain-containing protein [Ignavibacteriales bacterium]|nr:CBS domain-containing protein [Ignavibacteriales bacterium]
MIAKDILDVKGRKIFSIPEDTKVSTAVEDLVTKRIGLLVIKNINGETTGVLSERDILQKCVQHKKDTTQIAVKEIMTAKESIVAAAEEDDINHLMNIMTEKRIRHLPIFKGSEMSGIISIGDIIKNMVEIKNTEIKSLIDYISGKYPG